MAKAYKVKQDVSLPRAVRPLYDDSVARKGLELYQTEGRSYAAGDYVLAEDITPPLRRRAEEGKLSHVLEEVDYDEAKKALDEKRRSQLYSQFVPEHKIEAHAMELAGHEVVEVDNVGEQVTASEDVVPDAPVEEPKKKAVSKKKPSKKS